MPIGLRPRLRTGLRRAPMLFWTAAVVVAAGTGLAAANLVAEAAARADRLGGLRAVPVAARAVEAGHTLRPADVSVRRLPAAAVPTGPVARSPVGRPALVALAAGEVLLAAKLAPEEARGVAVLLPPGTLALAVPVDGDGLALERGHRVEVLATFDAATTGVDGEAPTAPTFAVATDALVVDVSGEAVTVAVTPDEAPRVAFAIARGTVTLALTSPTPNHPKLSG